MAASLCQPRRGLSPFARHNQYYMRDKAFVLQKWRGVVSLYLPGMREMESSEGSPHNTLTLE